MSDDDDSPELRAQNAKLLADLDRTGRLRPCPLCGQQPTIRRDPDSVFDRPMLLHSHAPDCPAGDAFDHELPAAETDVEPIRVALDWLRTQGRKRRSDE